MRILETERLVLRPFVIEDAQQAWEYQRDPEVTRYTHDGGIKTLEQIEDAIRGVIEIDYAKFGYGRMTVVHRDDNKVIGFAGLKYLADRDDTDLGYRFDRHYWGQGIATEACQAVMEFGWNDLGLGRIIGMADVKNQASIRVLQKLGFQFVANEIEDGIDVVVYAAVKPQSK